VGTLEGRTERSREVKVFHSLLINFIAFYYLSLLPIVQYLYKSLGLLRLLCLTHPNLTGLASGLGLRQRQALEELETGRHPRGRCGFLWGQ
jgi:hypothetical protein